MTYREELLSDYHKNAAEAIKLLKEEGFDFIDAGLVWKILIYKFNHFDIPTEVVHHNLTSQDIFRIVKEYFDIHGLPITTIIVEESLIPDEYNDELTKAIIKNNGEIWEIHQYDRDPFPSNPHAHNHLKNIKLHLGNGKYYRKTKLLGKIKKKELKEVRDKITQQTNISLPPDEYI